MRKISKYLVSLLPFKVRNSLYQHLLSTASFEEKIKFRNVDTLTALYNLKKNGLNPGSVLDIGAHQGLWSKNTRDIFPGATFFLFEPLPQKQEIIKKNCPYENMYIKNVLLGSEEKENVTFYSMDSGSSMLEEMTSFERETIHLNMTTLDKTLRAENIQGPILIKIDVQGFELEVLKGAKNILPLTEVICMEVSLLNYNQGAPLASTIIKAMDDYGFVLWDITGFFRKSTDNALIQTDVIFIRKNSSIRQKANNLLTPFKVVMN